jgi:membrane-associated phospholipid phosphatase
MGKKMTIVLFLSLVSIQYCRSQDIYQLKLEREILILTGGLTATTVGLGIHKNARTLTPSDIALLDRSKIWSIDRFATRLNSGGANVASDIFLTTSALLPLMLLTKKDGRQQWKDLAILHSENIMTIVGVTGVIKTLIRRTRPFVYNENASLDKKQQRDALYSFTSGHVTVSAASSFFTATVFSDLYPDSKWKPVVWALAATIPAVTAFCRVAAGEHFLTDVIGGYIIGAGVGILIPKLHKKSSNTQHLRIQTGINGLGLSFYF